MHFMVVWTKMCASSAVFIITHASQSVLSLTSHIHTDVLCIFHILTYKIEKSHCRDMTKHVY